jgi:hypothetical protein
MNRRHFLSRGTLAGVSYYVASSTNLPADADAAVKRRRGVTIAGAEFGVRPDFCNVHPGKAGKDYTYNSEKTVAYFAVQGVRLLRLPFRWEQ